MVIMAMHTAKQEVCKACDTCSAEILYLQRLQQSPVILLRESPPSIPASWCLLGDCTTTLVPSRHFCKHSLCP